MRRRGFTLLELMVAVAIIGAMSTLAVINLINMARVGRANGMAGALARIIGAARVRAVTQQCKHFVVINGPSYAPPPSAISMRSAAYIVRKANCNSTVHTLEPNDSVVDFYPLAESRVQLSFNAVSPGQMTTNSVLIAYDRLGRRFTGTTTNGSYTDVSVGGPIGITVIPSDPALARQVIIPLAGTPATD